MVDGYFLYRIFNADDGLLYVGATTNPGQRFTGHQHAQPWWGEVDRITVEHCGTLDELLAAELEAIRNEEPKYNIAGTYRPKPWALKPRRQRGEGTIHQRADGYWVAGIQLPPSPDGKRRYKRAVRKDRNKAILALRKLKSESLTDGA